MTPPGRAERRRRGVLACDTARRAGHSLVAGRRTGQLTPGLLRCGDEARRGLTSPSQQEAPRGPAGLPWPLIGRLPAPPETVCRPVPAPAEHSQHVAPAASPGERRCRQRRLGAPLGLLRGRCGMSGGNGRRLAEGCAGSWDLGSGESRLSRTTVTFTLRCAGR